MRLRSVSVLALCTAVLAGTTGFTRPAGPHWEATDTGTTARLRGLSAVSDRVAWASGGDSTVVRTVDGGASWQRVGPPVPGLALRDVEAFDAEHAVALAIGPGADSRVYRTDDGGTTWTETFRNDDERAFYDCMAFTDPEHGLALSDPVDGRFRILATSDGGRSWEVLPAAGMPPALDGEFAFAASGTCLVTADHGGDSVWFATGGGSAGRVFRSDDDGRTWQVTATPVPGGATAGIYSMAFHDPRHGLAVGGDFTVPDSAPDGAAVSGDGGRTWTVASGQPGAYRSGVAWAGGARIALAVGPTGSDVSWDAGATWQRFDDGSFDAVDCASGGACWASGERGRVAVLRWR